MMAYLDTSALLAVLDASDEYHPTAKELWAKLLTSEAILVASNYVLVETYALLQRTPAPTEEEIRWAISGNLCRCTGYVNIVEAIAYAADKLRSTPAAAGRGS